MSAAAVDRLVTGERARAAYELGRWWEGGDDLDRAADWYRRAAEAGSTAAALKLGDLLGRLAEAGGSPDHLMAEASRWLAGAVASPDAVAPITEMLNRQARLAARRASA